MQQYLKRTWATIDLSKIEHNYRLIREHFVGTEKKTMICAVVKANAYGHGDKVVAKLLDQCGADWFGVSNIEEGLALREAGITKPILIFGHTPCELAPILAKQKITQTCLSLDYAQELSDSARSRGVSVDIHIKVDTGMSRIGFVCSKDSMVASCCEEIMRAYALPALHATGIFTHFACSDEFAEDSVAFTKGQFSRFMKICETLEQKGYSLGIRHCCNSAAVVNYPEMHLDMVRPGIILYGCPPSNEMEQDSPFRPAMELKTTVSEVKEIPAGTSVSYGRIYTSDHPVQLASLTIGYADSFPRTGQPAQVLLHGKRVPVVGRVCMDQMMVDISGIGDVKMGDTATIFGRDGSEEITAGEFALLRGSVNYEVLCAVGIRVPRVYLYNGKITEVTDYISCAY